MARMRRMRSRMKRMRGGMRKMRSRMGRARRGMSGMRSRMRRVGGGMMMRMRSAYGRVRKRKYSKKEQGIGMLGMVAIAVVAVWFFFFKDKKQA